MNRKRGKTLESERSKIFSNLVYRREIRLVIWFICTRDKGSILISNNIDKKTGGLVKEVLQPKHPDSRYVILRDIPYYIEYSKLINIFMTNKYVKTITRKLLDTTRPSGTDATALVSQLLKYSTSSDTLH